MHKTILLITLLFVCFTSAHSLTDIEKKYYDNLEKQNQKLTEQVESQQKEINDLKLNQNRLENLVVNEPARLDKRIDDATKIFSVRLDFAIFFLGIIGLIITVSGIFFSILGININKTNKAIILKQKEYDKKLETLNSKADLIDERLENQKEKLPASNCNVNNYTPEDFKNLEEYVKLLRRDKAEKDYSAEEWLYLGLYYQNKNDLYEAIDAFDKAIIMDPNLYDARYNKAIALIKRGKYDDAAKVYDDLIKIDAHSIQAWSGKALILLSDDKYIEALETINKSLETISNHYSLLKIKAEILKDMGKLDEALEWINKAYASCPKDTKYITLIEIEKNEILEAIAERDKKKVEEENKDV